MTQELIDRLRDENLQEDEIRSYAREAAAALERLTAERDAALAASRYETDLCQQALHDVDLWIKNFVNMQSERNAAVECAAQEARYNNSLRDELAKNGEHLRYVEGQETLRCAEVRGLTAERDALKEGLDGWHKRYLDCEVERDAYQVAADQQAMAHKIEWDGLSMQVDALKADAARMTKALRSVIASLELGIGETERVHQYCEVPKSLLKECRNAIAKEQA
jgi:hypothetical protein